MLAPGDDLAPAPLGHLLAGQAVLLVGVGPVLLMMAAGAVWSPLGSLILVICANTPLTAPPGPPS